MNPKVDWFFNEDSRWQKEYELLRSLCLDCGLTEELKWGCPCYTSANRNIVLIHGFKDYCALLFFKGALLQDADGLLVQQTENVQSARQARFTKVQEIVKREARLKALIYEAIEVEKAGLKVAFKKPSAQAVPEELEAKFAELPALKAAFDDLTPGRQRAYLLHFSAPKQTKTRADRIEKSLPQILAGKGLNDR